MNVFDDYTAKLLLALNKHAVAYLIVGGYAVNYHGYRRTTGDIDLWIQPNNDNKTKIIAALAELGIEKEILQQLGEFDFTEHLVFSDGEEPFKIDFITRLSGVEFEAAWLQKIDTHIDNIPVAFIHLNDLILSKISNDRLKDKLDVEELQKINAKNKQ